MNELLIIGGSTYDITGKILGDTVIGDSNPSSVYSSPGGVGRNIAENCAHLGIGTSFITAVGNDVFSSAIKKSCDDAGIDTGHFITCPDISSSVYLTILNKEGELSMAASDLSALEKLPIETILEKSDFIRGFPVVFIDTNLTDNMIEVISGITSGAECITKKSKDTPAAPSCEGCDGSFCRFTADLEMLSLQHSGPVIYADTVSVKKAPRLLGILDKIHTLKANRTELEALTGVEVEDISDAVTAMEILIRKGVRRVFVTLGMKGSCVMEGREFFSFPGVPCEVRDVNGAGDAFMSAVIYGSLRGYTNRDILRLGTAASHLALKAEGAVNHELDEAKLLYEYNNLRKEM